MKNSMNISNDANLILNTYKCLFFKLLLRIFDVVGQIRLCKTSQRGNEKVLEFANGDVRNTLIYNGTKVIDVWNVNKLTPAWTKMEGGKIRTRVAQ